MSDFSGEEIAMPDPVINAFDLFDQRIQPTRAQTDTANKRASRLERALLREPQVSQCRPIGSLVRSTVIKKFSDVDILAVIDFDGSAVPEDSRELLVLASSVVGNYARLVTRNNSTVTLEFSTWPKVDILPAVIVGKSSGGGLFRIPTMSGGWQYYSPGDDDLLVSSAASRLGSRFKSIVRIFKWWSKSNNEVVSSFQIERLVGRLFVDKIPPYPQAMRMLFGAALHPQGYGFQCGNRVTADIPRVCARRDVLELAYGISSQAESFALSSDFRRCSQLWRGLLGELFPVVND